MDAEADVPEGFRRHDRRSGATAPWEPLYASRSDDAVVLAFRAAAPHANSRGFVHGGVISALMDNAMGLSCARRLGEGSSLVTVSLHVDFLGAARLGQWVAFETLAVRVGGTICFTQGRVTADGEPCGQASGVFRVVRAAPEAA